MPWWAPALDVAKQRIQSPDGSAARKCAEAGFGDSSATSAHHEQTEMKKAHRGWASRELAEREGFEPSMGF